MHVAVFRLFSRSNRSLTKHGHLTYHPILINVYFHFSQKQTITVWHPRRWMLLKSDARWAVCHGFCDNDDLN